MKSLFSLFLFISVVTGLNAQTVTRNIVSRKIQFRTIGRDSVNLNLNEDYDMIEDSCSLIIRQGHFNLKDRKFVGKFKDISKLDPSVVVSEGSYTVDGLKDGSFTSNYLNGKLRSKGSYKNDKYEGKWEIYYQDGKPELVFEARNDTITIINAWETDGKKTVDNGKGTYQVIVGAISWKGKLENGRPDGTWHAFKTDDATQNSMASESFKKGIFQKGNSPINSYTDASRINLINPDALPFNRAEKLHASLVPCNGLKNKHVVNAQYKDGLSSFSQYIADLARPAISRFNIASYQSSLTLVGDVSEQGQIVGLKTAEGSFNLSLAQAIINELHSLPPLLPATVDGKPVKQSFTITFTFSNGMYSFGYKFLPVKLN